MAQPSSSLSSVNIDPALFNTLIKTEDDLNNIRETIKEGNSLRFQM